MILIYRLTIVVFFSSIIFTSCKNNTLIEEQLSIENQIWNSEKKAVFEFEINDTHEFYDLYIYLRNTEDYPYSNIYIFTTLRFPNNKIAIDTLQCRLADSNGRWYGSGLGGVYENKIRLSRNKAFPLEGEYKMEINHAMREDELKGISDIGFAIEAHED